MEQYFTLTEIRNALTAVSFGVKQEVCMPKNSRGWCGGWWWCCDNY